MNKLICESLDKWVGVFYGYFNFFNMCKYKFDEIVEFMV